MKKEEKEKLKIHLANKISKVDSSLKGGGFHNYKGKKISHPHILKAKTKEEKYAAVCKWIERLKVSPDSFKKEKMNQFAHYLNSSQVLCYVFFKYLEENNLLTKFVKDNIGDIGVDANELKCEFEYVPEEYPDNYGSHQATNYDCRIFNDTFELLIEVKYTEDKFGTCANDASHEKKFDNCYRNLIENCKVLNADKLEKFKQMRPFYQLIRNVLQIREGKKRKTYCMFLYPKANEGVEKHYDNFHKSGIPNKEYDEFVKNVYWEGLFSIMSKAEKIKEVYFPETIFPELEK